MLVGDLVYSDTHDICFDYEIYDGIWNDGGKLLYESGGAFDCRHPKCAILDKTVSYMTIDIKRHVLIIECKE